MAITNWNQRFFSSTRGRIVVLLRRASRTVDELAQALDLTDNAVRTHLTTLERDGIVQQRGERRSTSKPAHVYDLTPAAEQLFPKAYGPVLQRLLAVLAQAGASGVGSDLARDGAHPGSSARWLFQHIAAAAQCCNRGVKRNGGNGRA